MHNEDGSVEDEGEKLSNNWWASLALRALHPIDVQVIEAFQWIGQPLSAGDLAQLFEGEPPVAVVSRRLRHLAKQLDAIELDERPTTRNITDIRYRLVQRPRHGC